ncbi:MAG: hypothetical protein R3267_06530 [Paenisporosarcina sp.]|nr:hypothetical protein [Paenisporosarcina sp.]
MNNTENNVHDQTYNELQRRIQEDEVFRNELTSLLYFYGKKFVTFAKKKEHEQLIETELEKVMHSQFFQGYYVMKEVLADSETQLQDTIWVQPKGVLRNELPVFLDQLFAAEQIDWTRTQEGHAFGMNVLKNFESAYEVAKQFRREIAHIGAYYAFLTEERYVGQPETEEKMMLGNPFDLTFLNPQVFLQAQAQSAEQELWDMFFWSAHQSNAWAGSVSYSIFNGGTQPVQLLEIKVSTMVTFDEQTDIINMFTEMIPLEHRESVQIRFYRVEDMEELQFNFEPVQTI